MASALAFESDTLVPEAPSAEALEITVLWDGIIRDVRVLHGSKARYVIGETPDADWVVPADELGTARVVLAEGAPDGDVSLHVPDGATVEVDEDGTWSLGYAGVTFVVRTTAAPRRLALPSTFDWREHRTVILSAVAHALLFFMVWSVPPSARALSLDSFTTDDRFSGFMVAPPDVPEPESKKLMAGGDGSEEEKVGAEGKPGEAAAGDEGKAGSKTSTNRSGRLAVAGSDDAIAVARRAADSAFVSYLGTYKSATSTIMREFGAETALGMDEIDALGHLMGDRVGEASGEGGWGLYDKGPGGGGDSDLLGICKDGEVCDGPYRPGTGPLVDGEPGHRPGGPHIDDTHREEKVEVVEPGVPDYRGGLSKEIIRRTVRKHLAEVKYCYEKELTRNPELGGKIIMSFVIDPTGVVVKSSVAASTMKNGVVESLPHEGRQPVHLPVSEGWRHRRGELLSVRVPRVASVTTRGCRAPRCGTSRPPRP